MANYIDHSYVGRNNIGRNLLTLYGSHMKPIYSICMPIVRFPQLLWSVYAAQIDRRVVGGGGETHSHSTKQPVVGHENGRIAAAGVI